MCSNTRAGIPLTPPITHLSLTLSVLHAGAGSFQKAIFPVPKGVCEGWDQESSGGSAILVTIEKAQAALRPKYLTFSWGS